MRSLAFNSAWQLTSLGLLPAVLSSHFNFKQVEMNLQFLRLCTFHVQENNQLWFCPSNLTGNTGGVRTLHWFEGKPTGVVYRVFTHREVTELFQAWQDSVWWADCLGSFSEWMNECWLKMFRKRKISGELTIPSCL